MTSKIIPSQIEELKKGCGKKYTHLNGYDFCGAISDYKGHPIFHGLCPTCQAKLQTLQDAQKYFLKIIDEDSSKNYCVPESINKFKKKLKSKIGGEK